MLVPLPMRNLGRPCEALRERFADASGELLVVKYPWVTSFTHMHNTKVQEKSVFI